MVQTQEDIDAAEPVIRAHQLELLVLGQITQVRSAKFAVGNENAHRLWVLGIVFSWLEIGAVGIRPACAGHRLDQLPRGSHHGHINATHANLVARFRHRVLGVGDELRIHLLQEIIGGLAGLDVWAMVDEFADGDLRSELRQPSEVVAVPVCNDQMIDLFKPSIFDRRHDAAGITNGARRDIARIHEQRFPGRRDKQRRIATLDVDYIDVEHLCRLALRNSDRSRKRHSRH